MLRVNNKHMLRVKNIKKAFSTPQGLSPVLKGISFQLKQNQILGVVGESGSGKSTLAKVLLGLHIRDQGDIALFDTQFPKRFSKKDFQSLSSLVQMVFQDPYSALNPKMQVWQLIEEPCLIAQQKDYLILSSEQRRERILEYLTLVGLGENFFNRFPHELSGGQQQRVGIARALILKPKLLICDEPISALDVSVQAQIVNLLKDLCDELGMSILFIAHDLAMVNYLCEDVMVMYQGSVVEQGPSELIFSSPLHPYTQLLLDANPNHVLEGKTQKNWDVQYIDGQGRVPSKGCAFANRCWKKLEECERLVPSLKPVETGSRQIACVLYD